jgi:hypothetical protein
MHVAFHVSRPPEEASLAEALLGSGDPLVSSLRRSAETTLQLWAATGALAGSAVTLVELGRRALPFVLTSAVVVLVLGIRVALRTLARRDAVRDLIISGRGELELPVIEHAAGTGARGRSAPRRLAAGSGCGRRQAVWHATGPRRCTGAMSRSFARTSIASSVCSAVDGEPAGTHREPIRERADSYGATLRPLTDDGR